MKAAWYEKQGPARDVLTVGEMQDPIPGAGEVRIRIAASGVNPGDIKKRQDAFGYGMPYPRVIPHSDGAGHIDRVGDGSPPNRWAGGCGAMERSPIDNLAPRQSTPSCLWIMFLPYPRLLRWNKVHVSGSPALPPIEPSMLLVL